jgi:hypothetical protein
VEVFFNLLIEQISKQGLSISLIATIAWYFYRRSERQDNTIQSSNERIIAYLKEDRAKLVQLVEQMSDVIEQNTTVLKAIEKKL